MALALPNMKSFLLCLTLINLIMLNQVEARYYIDPSVLDPCAKSENKPSRCGREEANKYNRGYVAINRRRNGIFRH
ncbi:hypothetical protein JCGZ_15320 [Jatropha curcas]|uniref:Rapid ALkalinization Factor n=1 Tax=Jatropha curcas TaxID=180498 RepID=A0A067LBM1_JATCU|nr:hypothetical protein JCGZ_15320 [Jatropha curcas]